MLDGGTYCGKGGTTMAAVHGPGDNWWCHVWSAQTTCGVTGHHSTHVHTYICYVYTTQTNNLLSLLLHTALD